MAGKTALAAIVPCARMAARAARADSNGVLLVGHTFTCRVKIRLTSHGAGYSVTGMFAIDASQGQLSHVVLSLFPGAGLLDRGFEDAGFIVVRGPDTLFGQDICRFRFVPGVVTGVIGGPPCQDFSRARRRPPTGHGVRMLNEFRRLVTEAQPLWWLLENVPGVPDVHIAGMVTQRFNLFASEFGCDQKRNRSFQFGSRDGLKLVIVRGTQSHKLKPAALAGEKLTRRRNFADLCELQGLPRDFDLPGLSRSAKIRAVGNGVPVPMAYAVACAIRERRPFTQKLCACDCGRPVTARAVTATAACRKRMERKRRAGSHSDQRPRHGDFWEMGVSNGQKISR
jgi:DNA (cytosine-5)-methyltransferase 1